MKKPNHQNLYGPKSNVQMDSTQENPQIQLSCAQLRAKKVHKKQTGLGKSTIRNTRRVRKQYSTLPLAWDINIIPQQPEYPDNLPEDNIDAVLYLMNKE